MLHKHIKQHCFQYLLCMALKTGVVAAENTALPSQKLITF